MNTRAFLRAAALCGASLSLCSTAAIAADATLSRAGIDARGWAVNTRGGAGGAIVRVTNLNAAGAGSFAAAAATKGPRVIVFEVGGVIDLQGASVRLDEPDVTVAGQTAPAPGITFVRGGLQVATHNVIVQHIAVRPGEHGKAKKSGWDADGLSTSAARDVIIDHCSFSWATDENLSASGPRFNGKSPDTWYLGSSHRITFSHNIIAEGLRNSTHKKGEHSKGSLVHVNAEMILFYGNLFNSNVERNPLVKGGARVALVNNLIHNPGAKAIHYNLIAHEWGERAPRTGLVTMVGNVLRAGMDTRPNTALFSLGGAGDVSVFMKDNIAVDDAGAALPLTSRYTASSARILTASTPYLPDGLPVVPAGELENAIYMSAGMRPWQRDAVDFKMLSDVAEGRGHIVDSEAESSGYPSYKASQRPFNPDEWHLEDMTPKAGWPSLALQ